MKEERRKFSWYDVMYIRKLILWDSALLLFQKDLRIGSKPISYGIVNTDIHIVSSLNCVLVRIQLHTM